MGIEVTKIDLWPCSHVGCGWWLDRPADLCEEHFVCESCGRPNWVCEVATPVDCLGPQVYPCQRCRRSFLQHQISRVGAAMLCQVCARNPMGPR